MVACGWVQHDHRLMWRQSDVLSGRPIRPRVLALGQSRLLTAMCWDCVRAACGQPWLSWRAGSASIAGIGTGLGDTLYCRPKFCAVFLCSAFCKRQCKMESISFAIPSSDLPPDCPPSPPPNTQSNSPPKAPGPSPLPQEPGRSPSRSPPVQFGSPNSKGVSKRRA